MAQGRLRPAFAQQRSSSSPPLKSLLEGHKGPVSTILRLTVPKRFYVDYVLPPAFAVTDELLARLEVVAATHRCSQRTKRFATPSLCGCATPGFSGCASMIELEISRGDDGATYGAIVALV